MMRNSYSTIINPSPAFARVVTTVNPQNVKTFVPVTKKSGPAGYSPFNTNIPQPIRQPKPFSRNF
jgi:hypothetical protein